MAVPYESGREEKATMVSAREKTSLKLLKKLINTRFAEFLRSRGFANLGEDRLTYRFRRRAHGHQNIVEVQFDKHQRPKFVINAGTHPAEGIVDAYGRFISAEKVHVSQLVDQARLYALPKLIFFERWFGIGHLSFGSIERACDKEIGKAIRLFDQVEDWLDTGSPGPNIYVRTVPQNRPGFAKAALTTRGLWPPQGWTEADEASLRK